MDDSTRKKYEKRKARSRANHVSNRLTYCPRTDKNKFTKKLRAQLQSMPVPPSVPLATTVTMEIGAININGLSMESSWALEEIVSKYNLKVHYNPMILKTLQTCF